MRWALSAGLALVIGLALAAQAQDRHPTGALFISPMGEPFRSTDATVPPIDVWFAAADADHDGKLSRAEFLAEAANFYSRLDANHDGYATSVESSTLWEAEAPEILEPWYTAPPPVSDPDDGSSRPRQHAPDPALAGAARFALLPDREPVMTCDTNFDRRVTADEFQACADRRFSLLDLNGDGFFTKDEVRWPGRGNAH